MSGSITWQSRVPSPSATPNVTSSGIRDTPEAAAEAVRLLTGGGFLASEVTVLCGAATADRLRESPGHSGLLGAVMRLADRLNVLDDELEEKRRYEEALRAGGVVLLVLAPTEERKQRAADVLRSRGGRSFAKTSSDSLRSSEIPSIRPLVQAASLFGGLGDRHPQAVGLCTVRPDSSRGDR